MASASLAISVLLMVVSVLISVAGNPLSVISTLLAAILFALYSFILSYDKVNSKE